MGEIWKIAKSETSPQGDKTQQAYEGEADFFCLVVAPPGGDPSAVNRIPIIPFRNVF
jgi:hypothetical protein